MISECRQFTQQYALMQFVLFLEENPAERLQYTVIFVECNRLSQFIKPPFYKKMIFWIITQHQYFVIGMETHRLRSTDLLKEYDGLYAYSQLYYNS